MRAAVYHGREDVRLEDVPEPMPGPGEIKLRVLYVGICGSDVHEFFDGPLISSADAHPRTGAQIPVILGHEFSGEIVGLGAGVSGVAIGDIVAVEPLDSCGHCVRCVEGNYHHCESWAIHGYTRQGGGLSQYTVVRENMAHKLPAGLSALHGALVEPMAVSYHCVQRAGLKPGDVVAIHGAGPIGIGALLAARMAGAKSIIVDPAELRREVARKLGAELVIDPVKEDAVTAIKTATGGHGARASIDAAGPSAVLQTALQSTGVDGRIVLVAMHIEPLNLETGSLTGGEIYLTGSRMYCNEFPLVVKAMAEGHYPLEGWVDVIAFDDFVDKGLKVLRRGAAAKLVVDVGNTI